MATTAPIVRFNIVCVFSVNKSDLLVFVHGLFNYYFIVNSSSVPLLTSMSAFTISNEPVTSRDKMHTLVQIVVLSACGIIISTR